MPFSKKLLLSVVVIIFLVAISIYSLFYSKHITNTYGNHNTTLEELTSIGKQSPQVNQLLQNGSVQINYRQLDQSEIQSFIKSGVISSNISNEIYSVDFLSNRTNSGITLIIDLENKNILRSQIVVEVGIT